MQQETETDIKEEFFGEAFKEHIYKALIQVAGEIRNKFEDEICIGTYSKLVGLTLYEMPCIFTRKTVTKKKLWVFHKEAIEKKIVLEIFTDDNELYIYVFDERVLEAAREAFEKLKNSKDEFREYKIVIKKDFKTAS